MRKLINGIAMAIVLSPLIGAIVILLWFPLGNPSSQSVPSDPIEFINYQLALDRELAPFRREVSRIVAEARASLCDFNANCAKGD
jgi:hypothetical protein